MELDSLIKQRFSPRAFAEKSVSEQELKMLFEAARWAPSSRNEQPWRFIYASKSEIDEYNQLLSLLSEWNQRWAKSAPLLMAAVAKKNFDYKQLPNRHWMYDLGQAVAYLSLQAADLGLFVHQMGGFDAIKAKDVLNLPEDYEVITIIALGYRGNIDRIPEAYHQEEHRIRKRIPVDQFVFKGKWS